MTYTFTETNRGNIIFKTIDKIHTNLFGWQELSTKYPDSIVTDKFYIISHTKSDEDSEGNCYDWYDVKDRYRQIDTTPPLSKSISDNDMMTVDQEYRLSLIEVNMPSTMSEEDKTKPGLYDTLLRMINRGQTDGLDKKIDIFFATGAITPDQYNELLVLLNPTEPEVVTEVKEA